MRNDGVDIEKCNDTISNGYNVCFIDDSEWLQYTFELSAKKDFDVAIRYSSQTSGGKLYLEDESGRISKTITLPTSGNETNWKTIILKKVALQKGINRIKVHFEKGGFKLNYFEFLNH